MHAFDGSCERATTRRLIPYGGCEAVESDLTAQSDSSEQEFLCSERPVFAHQRTVGKGFFGHVVVIALVNVTKDLNNDFGRDM